MPSSNTMTAQLDILSHLKLQRLTEELVVARKKHEEYEDLISKLYHNVCEYCKGTLQRIGASAVLNSSLAARHVAKPSPSNAKKCSSHASSTSTKPFWTRMFKHPRISPRSLCSRHGPTTSRVDAPTSSNLNSASPSEDQSIVQAQFFVETPGPPTLEVTLERVWTFTGNIESAMKFSPDGKYLVVGVCDHYFVSQKTYMYGVENWRKICVLEDRYAPLPNKYSTHLASFSPGDERYLATGHSSGQVMIWQVGRKHVRNAFGPSNCVDFSPNGRSVVSGSYLYPTTGARIWSMRDGSSILLPGSDRSEGIVAVKFSPDGKHVVASDFQGMLSLWNIRRSKVVRKWATHQNYACSMAFTPNGSGLVTAGDNGTIKYWDLGPPRIGRVKEMEKLKFVGNTNRVWSVAISPDGRWLGSGSDENTVHIWDMVDGSLKCTLLGHEGTVNTIDFSPTGNYLACGSWKGRVSVWRINLFSSQ